MYDPHDTIAAVASPPGGAARGIIRISGPSAITAASRSFLPDSPDAAVSSSRPNFRDGVIALDLADRSAPTPVPCRLLLWPTASSYTRQPSAEIHTLGSPPLLQAMLEQLCCGDVRLAQPGEFTLRAFLAGRIDLTQAEAVLGVIDADNRVGLDRALAQLAGGLSRPLDALRERLLSLLAELEAGLDFADEDIEFISSDALRSEVVAVRAAVAATIDQLRARATDVSSRRVVLIGPPNAGKSSLFNALLERFGDCDIRAIVTPTAGTTTDYVEARVAFGGIDCWLVDTAGEDASDGRGIAGAAQGAMAEQRRDATLQLDCRGVDDEIGFGVVNDSQLPVVTKIDLRRPMIQPPAGAIACSAMTGDGIIELADRLAVMLADHDDCVSSAGAASARTRGCLERADAALDRAAELVDSGGGEELVAAEIRGALDALGEVVGAVYTDDVLDRIFGQFCIGK